MRSIISCIAAVCALAAVGAADDLYQVDLSGPADAASLRSTGVEAVVRTGSGYLVLADLKASARLLSSGLSCRLIAANIDINSIALDNRLDRYNVDRYPLIFEHDNLRVYRVDLQWEYQRGERPQLSGVNVIPIVDPPALAKGPEPSSRLTSQDAPLDSLIDLVSTDSLISYLERLQAFQTRVAGTDSNYASRDWLADKFVEIGYDSVVIDSFVENLYGLPSECQNVLAYKVGSVYPNHHIIVGAHRDAVPTSPGADDNGSGTVGVLEIARALLDVETEMTFVFALFDAEEYGLHGSWHYADEAAARGDTIVYMLNMDMIAHLTNTDQAKVYHGSSTNLSIIWLDLADSLVGITGHLSGSSAGSDHYPFTVYGWDVSFIHEYIFSTVYHSARDSTAYVNYPYMTKLVQASLAAIYTVSQTQGPQPQVSISLPYGPPTMAYPNRDTTITVLITGAYGGSPVPGSGTLYYSLNGAEYVTVQLESLGDELWQVTLPGADCGDQYDYFFSADEVTQGTFFYPDPGSPLTTVVANESVVAFEDNFETNKGWTVSGNASDGQWNRGIPAGGGDRGDPPTDYDGSGQCYLTDNEDDNSDVDNGTTILTSPSFDLSSGDAEIRYARWYSNSFGSAPFEDSMLVYISNNDGLNWAVVESVGPEDQAAGGWYVHKFWASDFVVPTATMRVRFDAADLATGSVVEAAVDMFLVTQFRCGEDSDGDGLADIHDNCAAAYNPEQEDLDEDGFGDSCDVCILDPDNDIDQDGLCANEDNCPTVANAQQTDTDGDGIGDACCCVGIRGNIDDDVQNTIDIADLVYLVEYSFGNPPGNPPGCPNEADVDNSSSLDIADVVYLVDYMFGDPQGDSPANCL